MMRGVKVFGTGFPTLARSMPYTEVTENYVLYSDKSHLSFTPTPGVLELWFLYENMCVIDQFDYQIINIYNYKTNLI